MQKFNFDPSRFPVPRLGFPVTGRPLPKGMSKCIVGFIVTFRSTAK